MTFKILAQHIETNTSSYNRRRKNSITKFLRVLNYKKFKYYNVLCIEEEKMTHISTTKFSEF